MLTGPRNTQYTMVGGQQLNVPYDGSRSMFNVVVYRPTLT